MIYFSYTISRENESSGNGCLIIFLILNLYVGLVYGGSVSGKYSNGLTRGVVESHGWSRVHDDDDDDGGKLVIKGSHLSPGPLLF